MARQGLDTDELSGRVPTLYERHSHGAAGHAQGSPSQLDPAVPSCAAQLSLFLAPIAQIPPDALFSSNSAYLPKAATFLFSRHVPASGRVLGTKGV